MVYRTISRTTEVIDTSTKKVIRPERKGSDRVEITSVGGEGSWWVRR